jgi:hypothetical protein
VNDLEDQAVAQDVDLPGGGRKAVEDPGAHCPLFSMKWSVSAFFLSAAASFVLLGSGHAACRIGAGGLAAGTAWLSGSVRPVRSDQSA